MFKERIQENYKRLTPGFRKLADHILQNTIDAAFLTPTELARQVNVDPTTIVGFCRELGYNTYEDLSQEIRQHIRQQLIATYQDIHTLEEAEFLNRLQSNLIQHLQQFQATQTAILTQAIAVLRNAPRVWAVGDFLSFEIASIFVQGLQMLGKPATVSHTTMTEIATYLTHMQAGEVMFAVAIKHYDIDTSYALKLARAKGLKTICLAGAAAEMAAREAEITLTIPPQSSIAPLNFEAPLAIIGLIWEALVAYNKTLVAEKFTGMYTIYGRLCKMRAQGQD